MALERFKLIVMNEEELIELFGGEDEFLEWCDNQYKR